jgi:hypothetical protein
LGYQQKSVDEFFNETYNMRLPIQLGGQFYIFTYAGDKQDMPLPVLISFEKEKTGLIKITKDLGLEGIRFSQVQKINSKKYLGIYRNESIQQNGIMVLEIDNEH